MYLNKNSKGVPIELGTPSLQESPQPHLWPAMPETHPTPDPIPIRPRLHRQSPSLRELRTKKTRPTGSRNPPPRLLTVETGTRCSGEPLRSHTLPVASC